MKTNELKAYIGHVSYGQSILRNRETHARKRLGCVNHKVSYLLQLWCFYVAIFFCKSKSK